MRFIIFGAGGIGGTIGARLLMAGREVVLLARGPHLEALKTSGLRFVAPDGPRVLEVNAVEHPHEVDWRDDDVVLLTVKSQQTTAALAALSGLPETVPIVCAQNGVANERMALRVRPNVYGMVVNLPALHLRPGEVVTHASGAGGILDVGRFPLGSDDVAEGVAAAVSAAGFSARADAAVLDVGLRHRL